MPDGFDGRHVLLNERMIAEAVSRLELSGGRHLLPVVRALGQGRIVVVLATRGLAGVSIGALKRHPLPALIILSDDDHASSGPAGFPDARKALRYAAAHMIHGTGGKPEHYEAAILMAEGKGSCCLVETDAAHLDEWATFAARAARLRRVPTLILHPTDGGHPIIREAVH